MTVPGENELHAESILLVPLRWADTDSSPRDGQLTPRDAYADAGRHQVRGLAAIVLSDANDVGGLLGLDHLGQFLAQLWAIVITATACCTAASKSSFSVSAEMATVQFFSLG
jgi:hypothetical protein